MAPSECGLSPGSPAEAEGGGQGPLPLRSRADERPELSPREIVHDLANSLVAIEMFAKYLIDTTTQNGAIRDPGVVADLEMMRTTACEGITSCERLRESLDASTTPSGRRPREAAKSEVELIDLSAFVRRMELLIRGIAGSSTQVHYRLQSDLPQVAVEGAQLRQLLVNLALNAFEALESNSGQITIETSYADRSELESEPHRVMAGRLLEASYVCLRIADNGCGIPPAVGERIFDAGVTTKPRGHGDGLSSVRKIVEAHRGAVLVGETPGGGTTVRVLLSPCSSSRTCP